MPNAPHISHARRNKPMLRAARLCVMSLGVVVGHPASYSCDFNCMSGLAPGGAFGMMGIPTFGPAPTGDNCRILAGGVPVLGYRDGEEYTLTVTSSTALAQKVVCNDHAAFASPSAGGVVADGFEKVLTAEYTWTPTGSGDVVFHALCGAGGAIDEMWVADALTIARDASQGDWVAPTSTPSAAVAPALAQAGEAAATPPPGEPTVSSVQLADGLGVVRWSIVGDSIDMTVDFQLTTWIALGFSAGDALSMEGGGEGSDVVACHGDPPVVKRYWITSKRQPSGGVDIAGATCTRASGTTSLSFQRPLSPSGNQQAVTPGTTQPIIYAHGDSHAYTFLFHGPSRGGLSVDFSSGSATETEKKSAEIALLFHLICMSVCWGGVLPWGVAIANRGRKVAGAPAGAWFKRHRMLQSIGLGGMLLGFIFALWHCESNVGTHFNGLHTYIGIIVVVLGALQPLNAALRPHSPKDGEVRSVGRLAFEMAHKGSGWFAVVFGMLNVITGLFLLIQNGYNTTAVAVAASFAVFSMGPVLCFFVLATVDPHNFMSKALLCPRGPGGEGAQLNEHPVAVIGNSST